MDISQEELEIVFDSLCDGCKGLRYFWESDCRATCDAFIKEVIAIRKENHGSNA